MGQDSLFEKFTKYWSAVPFIHARDRNGELNIADLVCNHICSIVKMICKQEK